MEKTNQRKMEKELQKALAIAYVTPFCLENNLSLEKLQFWIIKQTEMIYGYQKRSKEQSWKKESLFL